jgi:hypothetical protein
MAPREPSDDIDYILQSWPFEPGRLSARLTQAGDGRDVLQMRIEMGLLQMETTGRPDGEKPEGFANYVDLLQSRLVTEMDVELSPEECMEIDREFVQLYHRRICWLALREYERAVLDAEHTLKLMDYCLECSSDEEWVDSHEHFRPFVMFHRIQAKALIALESTTPEQAIEELNQGLEDLRTLYEDEELEEEFEEDDIRHRLVELRETLREQFDVGQTLREQLQDAVATEQYELAAKLRDRIDKRGRGMH